MGFFCLFVLAANASWKVLMRQTWEMQAVTSGTVTGTKEKRRAIPNIGRGRSGVSIDYCPVIIYEFQVGGERYVGESVDFDLAPCASEPGTAARPSIGSAVPEVHYNPENPRQSMLNRPEGFMFELLAIVSLVVGSVFSLWVAVWLWRSRRESAR